MRPVRPLLVAALLATSAMACGPTTRASDRVFDTPALNATWYGAYARPLPPAASARSTPVAAAPTPTPSPRPVSPAPGPATPPAEPKKPVASAPTPSPRPTPKPQAAPKPAEPRQGGATTTWEPEHAAAYVRDTYRANETKVANSDTPQIVDIYRYAQDKGTVYHSAVPAVGDLVFFHNTWDRNGDGRANDWFTHVGIVEDVENDGTVSVLSWYEQRVSRIRMNVGRPTVGEAGGSTVNTRLRTPRSGDPPWTQYMAGELFAGFASLLGNRTEVTVLDDWKPGQQVANR